MLVFDVVLLTLQFWTFFTPFSNVSIVDTEQVNVSWVLTPSNQAKTYTTGQGVYSSTNWPPFTRGRNSILNWVLKLNPLKQKLKK